MSSTPYSSLHPTGDLVAYDNATVEYPASNVVDTFGQIWVSKVHGYEMNILEIASAGKISFTPSNEHSLDLVLDNDRVKLQARNDTAIVLANEDETGNLTIFDDGRAALRAVGGANVLQMDASGNLLQAGGSGDNMFVVPSARTHCFTVGSTDVLCVEEDGASVSNLTVNGTDFRVPVGDSTDRPAGSEGQIFYNSSSSRFEGFASGAWSGLGGTIDVDQDTFVSAETSPNADNDQLLFVTAGAERMRIDSDGRLGYGTATPQFDLDLKGDAEITTSGGSVLRLDDSGLMVDAGAGSNLFAAQDHFFDVGAANVVSIDGSGLSSSNLTVNGTSFLVPRGPEASRPAGTDGQIFYNEDTGRFEGFASAAWGGLGGTVDVNQDTYVSAEDNPGDDNNELKFVTSNVERMRITDTGFLGYGTSNPQFTVDVVGDLRVSGSIIADSTAIGKDGVMELGVQTNGSRDVVDGPTTNDGSGLKIIGVPSASLFSSQYKDRFSKSLTWHYNASGMETIGQASAWESESFWKLRGGPLRLCHTNADTGAEVEMIMRVNEKDEFQIVRHTVPTNGEKESYDVIARFGNKRGEARLAPERGHVVINPDLTSMDTAAATVAASVESFSAYENYVVHGALFPISASPTVSEVVSASATANGFRSSTLSAGQDNLSSTTFSAMHDGSAIPNQLLKFAGVIELGDGTLSASPHISFVLNSASEYANLALAAGQQTQSVVNYKLTFSSLTWNQLSATDKAVFELWLENQVLQTLQGQGVDAQSINFAFTSSSIAVDIGVAVFSADTTKVLSSATSAVSTAVISTASTTPIEFVDRPKEVITGDTITKVVQSVVRIQTAPLVASVSLGASTDTTLSFTYEVSEANPDFAVTVLYALATTTPLASPLMPSKIVADGRVQIFGVSSAGGIATINVDTTVQNYLYFVAANNVTPSPVLSPVVTATTSLPTSINLPGTVPLSESSGFYEIASQSAAGNNVTLESRISAFSEAESAEAHMLLYEAGDAALPADAADAKSQVDAGATAASAILP